LTRTLLDTSVVIAGAQTLKLQQGQTAAISVITLGELRAGVQLASDPPTHAGRRARLAAIRSTFEPLPIDESIAEQYGDILATARANKRSSKATDLLIIATAAATGRTLYTFDEAQASLARMTGVPVQP
jgi:predicted nucleic acid-binding protein